MRSFKGKIGVFVICVVPLIPVLLWLSAMPLSVRFESVFMTLTSIGQLTAIIGMALFSLGLILSARLHFLEDYFGGLDRMYNVHHITGTLAFILLLVHPLMLAVRYIPLSLHDAAQFLLLSSDWPKNFGILSLLLFMLLLCVTFFAKWRYQILRFLHQILGFAFFLAGLHTFMIPSDVANNTALNWFMLALVYSALLAFIFRTFLGRSTVPRFTYTVQSVRQLDATITEVTMVPESARIHYLPGQFIFIYFIDGGIEREVHPFSISSSPAEQTLRITVKALGDYTKSLRNLQVGATAMIEGPFGAFTYLYGENLRQIWIAGGIGITPFLNMARNLRANKHTGHIIDFYYSTRTKEEMIFLNELNQISQEYPNLRVIPCNADEKGFLTMDAVALTSRSLEGKDIYVCGPPPMMHSIIEQCRAKRIPMNLIHSEEFKLL